ncbi:unnamed protein product [Sympodiomycopsis kandeliae]
MPPRSASHNQREAATFSKEDIVHSGWVLKKKRKKMQGYAKRFLILTKQGILTYSLAPEKPTRDAIEVPHASVTSSQRHGTLHVDSGSSVFHIKMLNQADFEQWRSHLRSFIPERAPGSAQKIFVASNGSSELVAVDLAPVFNASITVGKLIQEVQSRIGEIKSASTSTSKGIIEGMASLVLPRNESYTEAIGALSTITEQLSAEHANLTFALQSRIPPVTGAADGTMHSLKSTKGAAKDLNASRLSISSFNTTGTGNEGVFYDADAAEGAFHDDQAQEESRDESSGGEELEDDDDADSDADDDDQKPIKGGGKSSDSGSKSAVQYRSKLPATVSGDEVSLFSMLKKNVGKDLSTISFPVSFNCPLSLLQASCEEYEYAPELLERASKTQDWVERICLVAAFAVSSYSSTKLRASRKPFNPLLGETFECVRPDKNLRFVAEKVVHQPPIVASYAEGKGWHTIGWSAVKNKFWGKSLELIPEGSTRLEFDDGDVFSFSKPSSFMRNLLAGNKYLEHVGELTVENVNTGQKAVVEFKEGNMWGGSGSRNQVTGTVYDERGKKVTGLKGKWSDNFARQKDDENYQVLWQASEMPKNTEDYYGFTYFAMSLNEMTDDIKPYLPPTDTRLRPDQRYFEEGKVDDAEQTKQTLENKQRQRRKEMESKGDSFQPRWFHKDSNEDPEWQYGGESGQYFKKRDEAAQEKKGKASEKKTWEGLPELFATD